MPQATSSIFAGLGVETTRGTLATTITYLPVRAPAWTPDQQYIEDKGLRGSAVDVYDLIAGQRWDSFDFQGDVFLDTFPNLIRSVLGSTDTLVGASAPWTHKFSTLNNSAATGNQPPSYSLMFFDAYAARQMLAGQADELNLKFAATGLLEYAVKFLAQGATTATTPTPAFTTERPAPAWDVAVTIGGVGKTNIVDGEIDLKRATKPIQALTGTQAPYQLWAGPQSTSGKITIVRETDTELSDYLNNTQPTVQFTFTDPASTNTLLIHSNACAFKTGKVSTGKDYVEEEFELVFKPNTVDATAGGYSPLAVTVSNSVSTAY